MAGSEYLQRPDAEGHLKVMEVLRRWDPIGAIGADNQDEYDSYSPEIVRMLDRGVTAELLAAHLSALRIKDMGMQANPRRDIEIATELVAWWKGWKQSK